MLERALGFACWEARTRNSHFWQERPEVGTHLINHHDPLLLRYQP